MAVKHKYDEDDMSEEEEDGASMNSDDSGEENMDEPAVKKPKGAQKNKSKKKLKKGVEASEEIRTLNDFEANVANLQIKELLKDVTVKPKCNSAMTSWFQQVHTLLMSGKIPKKLPSSIVSPLRELPDDPRINDFQFLRPAEVCLVGSFAYELATKDSSLDMAVEMPAECFANGDFHNLRYHRKRALYLMYIAAVLKKSELAQSLSWFCDGDERRPILVASAWSGTSQFKVNIHCFPHPSVFSPSRFAPDKLNIQEKFYKLEKRQPCPIYNGNVLKDVLLTSTVGFVKKYITSVGMREAVQLLKVWLKLRGLSDGPDGFSNFHLSVYAAWMVKIGKLNPLMGSYQAIRALLAAIQGEDWLSRKLRFADDSSEEVYDLFVKQKAAGILIDESNCHNYLYTVSTHVLDVLKEEAKIALQCLNTGSVAIVNDLFTVELPFFRRFDCYAKVRVGHAQIRRLLKEWEKVDYGGFNSWPFLLSVLSTLRRAFGKRVQLLSAKPLELPMWGISDEVPGQQGEVSFDIGWVLNPEVTNHVEKGPPADAPEAIEFRNFWGDISQIRRFQDGTILETVLWKGETAEERRSITEQIAKYILNRKFTLQGLQFCTENVSKVLHLPKCLFPQKYALGEEIMVDINKKFNEFAKTLRALEDLPLDISAVQGLSEEFSYTSVFPQVNTTCDIDTRCSAKISGRFVPKQDEAIIPRYVKPLEVVLMMESSSKWPDDVTALRHLRTAFYIDLATKLKGRTCQVFKDGLLVLYQGLVFRVTICCPKEVVLVRQEKTPEGMVKAIESKEGDALEFNYFVLPQLRSALHGVHLQHSSFSTTCRLAKRWLSCHLLHECIPSLAIDLIVASIYLSPLPYSLPNSARAGFQRFLHFMGNFDWRLNPLTVNFNNHYNNENLQEVSTYFTRNRQSLPAMYIRTPYDKKDTSYITRENPLGPLLHRAASLARKSLQVLESRMNQMENPMIIFRTSGDVYDFIITLDDKAVATYHQNLDCTQQMSFSRIRDDLPVVDFDPVRLYMKDLEEAFGHLCAFFFDGYGGTTIGGLWIPKAQVPCPFKVHNMNGRRLTGETNVLTPNYSALFSDMKVLGQGLVKSITEQRYPNNRRRKDST